MSRMLSVDLYIICLLQYRNQTHIEPLAPVRSGRQRRVDFQLRQARNLTHHSLCFGRPGCKLGGSYAGFQFEQDCNLAQYAAG